MLPPADLDGLSHADLKSLVLKLLEEVAELRRTVAAQRDEIARLKGGPGRPNIKPSGMDKATEPRPPPPTGSEPRQKGGKTSKLSIHEERTVTIAAPPQGSRFKGYTNFVVQDLVIRSHVVNFRRERWQKCLHHWQADDRRIGEEPDHGAIIGAIRAKCTTPRCKLLLWVKLPGGRTSRDVLLAWDTMHPIVRSEVERRLRSELRW